MFLPITYDWRFLKATCIQESRLDPFAVSPVGARGLCQFMPGTWRDAIRSGIVDKPQDVWLPEASIRAAAWYLGQGHQFWSSPRPAMDCTLLATAGYNAGNGNIHKAQQHCNMAVLYKDIIPCLPQVTGHHSRETIGYVENIFGKWWPQLLLE